MKSREEIRDFIRRQHRQMTVEDMADALCLPNKNVGKWCIRMGVTPLTVKERNMNFVRDNKDNMSVEKMAKALEMGIIYFMKVYAREFNLALTKEKAIEAPKVPKPEKKEEPPPKTKITPREVLSGFQLSGAGHYYDPSKDMVLKLMREIDDKLK